MPDTSENMSNHSMPVSRVLYRLCSPNKKEYQALTDKQKDLVDRLLYHALLEIRLLGWLGKAEQATDLADVFHNLPEVKYSDQFSFSWLRCDLEWYQNRYRLERGYSTDYVEMLDKIKQEEDGQELPPVNEVGA